MNTTQLDTLRRRVITRCASIQLALIDRPTPWRDWQSVERQLSAMGFRPVGDDEQSEHELVAMLWFCNMWLDLLAVTENVTWFDPPDDDE